LKLTCFHLLSILVIVRTTEKQMKEQNDNPCLHIINQNQFHPKIIVVVLKRNDKLQTFDFPLLENLLILIYYKRSITRHLKLFSNKRTFYEILGQMDLARMILMAIQFNKFHSSQVTPYQMN
ncbi:unnamed protein product, partial (macronuclear) [Paramecium tetraurelia]